ncbi:hypothetical protein B0H13DRAFT_1887151 [Mycena leptocephala]|nr:hypothetical protein B0H13DRAFT_1887151 [Mycena leptocephala]
MCIRLGMPPVGQCGLTLLSQRSRTNDNPAMKPNLHLPELESSSVRQLCTRIKTVRSRQNCAITIRRPATGRCLRKWWDVRASADTGSPIQHAKLLNDVRQCSRLVSMPLRETTHGLLCLLKGPTSCMDSLQDRLSYCLRLFTAFVSLAQLQIHFRHQSRRHVIASDSVAESDLVTADLSKHYKITDKPKVDFHLGCSIVRWRSRRTIKLHQESLLRAFFEKLVLSRAYSGVCLKTDAESERIRASFPYCSIVGKWLYLSGCTRPDISYTVRELAGFMSNYGEATLMVASFGTRAADILLMWQDNV